MTLALLTGALFGALLEIAGLTRHERITGVFLLEDLAVMRFLTAGLVTGGLVLTAAESLGLAGAPPIVPTHLVAQAVGGALFGVAMAAVGFCPGTIAAGAGAGRLDALVPGVLGLVVGGWIGEALLPRLPGWMRTGDLGAVTVPGLLGVSPWLVLILLAEIGILALGKRAPAARARGWRRRWRPSR